ncbi:MAG: hypothetical protein ABIR96_07470 [Bdellovibrionota bacterium]
MKKMSIGLYLLLASIMTLGACAQQRSASAKNDVSRGTTTNGGTTVNTSVRYCTKAITGSSSGKLSDFFSVVVSGLEGNPTFCHEISGVGTSGVDVYFMLEYEDNAGIRSVDFGPDNIVSSKLVQSGSNYSFEVIFKDAYGLVKVVASGPQSTGILNGSVYYYNFPTYEEALNAAIAQLQLECKNGTKTVYECLGYVYPTAWWNQALTPTQADMAKTIMSDSTKRKLLGNVQIDVGQATYPH